MGELKGKQVQPREIARLAVNQGITSANDLSVIVAIALAESQGFDRAFNDNLGGEGQVLSRDCGIWQINIPAEKIGTQAEFDLYDHVKNAAAMYALFTKRGFQPWAAWNSGVCFHDSYLQRGVLGVTNLMTEWRVADAKKAGTYQTTPVPLYVIKQLPYLND